MTYNLLCHGVNVSCNLCAHCQMSLVCEGENWYSETWANVNLFMMYSALIRTFTLDYCSSIPYDFFPFGHLCLFLLTHNCSFANCHKSASCEQIGKRGGIERSFVDLLFSSGAYLYHWPISAIFPVQHDFRNDPKCWTTVSYTTQYLPTTPRSTNKFLSRVTNDITLPHVSPREERVRRGKRERIIRPFFLFPPQSIVLLSYCTASFAHPLTEPFTLLS